MIIAVDGPAASGKGTLARALAAHFGFNYLDTGSLYRMVAHGVLRSGGDPANVQTAHDSARSLELDSFEDSDLRAGDVAAAASVVAAMPQVRDAILETQRVFAAKLPGAVLDGRDIGTVVCPDADLKLFVTASADVRARRRHAELQRQGENVSYEQVLADLIARDARDKGRTISPLKAAEDAHLLDSSDLSIEAAFSHAVALVNAELDKKL